MSGQYIHKPHKSHAVMTIVIILVILSLDGQKVAASVTTTHKQYLPLVLKDYKSPPAASTSRYMGYNNNEPYNLNWNKVENLGCSQGQAIVSGQDIVVVLSFGMPSRDDQGHYGAKIYDSPYYNHVYTSTISYWSKAYLHGFWECSPTNAHLSLALGVTNEGPDVGMEHGKQWAKMVNDVAGYITAMYYSSKESVFGAINNELDWNGPTVSLDWATGYGSAGTREYLNFGNCAGCPTEAHPGWDPNGDWTREDVYLMADGKFLAEPLPLIYAVDGVNAEQWYFLSVYSFIYHEYPLSIHGSFTQWDACQDRPADCYIGTSNATDNRPEEGWLQLWRELVKDPRTVRPLDWSTDISWKN